MPPDLLLIVRAVQIGASILLAGVFAFKLIVLRAEDGGGATEVQVIARLFRLAWWSALVALFSALVWFGFEVTKMSRLSLTAAFRGTTWRTVLVATRFGHVWQLRLLLVAASLTLIGLRQLTDRWPKSLDYLLSGATGTLLVSLAWISHPAAVPEQPLGVIGDALHLAAAGVWLGGLPCLAIYLMTTRGATSPLVLQRFSTLSLVCVSVLVISGVSNAWLLVGSVTDLFKTRYGALLLVKLMLFGLLLVLGARNRMVVRKSGAGTPTELISRLRREVACEIALGFGVIAIVGWLGVTPPPQSERVSVAVPVLPNEFRTAAVLDLPIRIVAADFIGRPERKRDAT